MTAAAGSPPPSSNGNSGRVGRVDARLDRGRHRQEERQRDAAVTPGKEPPGRIDDVVGLPRELHADHCRPPIVGAPHALTRSSSSLRGVRDDRRSHRPGATRRHRRRATRFLRTGPTVHGHGADRRDQRGDQALRAHGRRRRAVDRRSARARHRIRRAERRGEDDHDAAAARSCHRGFRRGTHTGEALHDHRETADRRRSAARRARVPSEPLGAKPPPLACPEQRHSVERERTRCCGSSGSRTSPVGARERSRSGCGSASASPRRCSAIHRS